MKNTKTITTLLIVAGIGIGFAGGFFFRSYQLQKMRSNFTGNGNLQRFAAGNRPQGQNGNGMRGGVMGSVIAIDEKSMTVKLSDGSSKIILFSDSTTYSNTVESKKTDLKVGANIAVFGPPNSDGSVTATTIRIIENMLELQNK